LSVSCWSLSAQRQSVGIDRCPACGGTVLERGELTAFAAFVDG
jgi:Zn-finger nucleic acid-binding protein